MPVEYKGKRAVLRACVAVEEAEGLLEWLEKTPAAGADLSACTHLHTACLQVMMTGHARILRWPDNAEFRGWLEPVLASRD